MDIRIIATDDKFDNITYLPGDTPFNVSVYGINRNTNEKYAITTVDRTYIRTVAIYGKRNSYFIYAVFCLHYTYIATCTCIHLHNFTSRRPPFYMHLLT